MWRLLLLTLAKFKEKEKPMRVLCVCLGNICRSPSAEGVLRAMGGAKITVDSAGTEAWHVGNPPYGPAIEAGRKRGYDLSPLRARAFQRRDFSEFDLILAMDTQNLADIEAMRPTGNHTPVRLFMEFAQEADRTEVPDPYFTGDFEDALNLIEAAARGLVRSL